jgi:NAD(P)-dependent dehydrogenase (short-subunit alcohol dehydrogenase family)
MSGQLSGRVAIVTGGAGGIGSRIAKEFASQGARVVVASRGQEKLDKIVAEIKSVGGEALGVATDVTDPAQVDNMVSRTISEFGQVDIMVNNAGGPCSSNQQKNYYRKNGMPPLHLI